LTKITMREVYRKLETELYDQLDEARQFKTEVIRLDFRDFSRILRSGDFVTTVTTLRSKWESAIADEVIQPLGNERYGRALLVIAALDRKVAYTASKQKNVCVCVCNTDTAESSTEEARV